LLKERRAAAPLLLSAHAARTRGAAQAAVDRYLLPAECSAANSPLLSIDGTDGRMNKRTLDRFIDPAPHTMRAATKCSRSRIKVGLMQTSPS